MPSIKLRSPVLESEDDLEAIYDEYYRKGWTDGLPIVPPTEERVARMIEASGRAPEEEVGIFSPRQARGTVEQIAVNAVMAGCRPEYFPVVLAIAEGLADPAFDLFSVNTTTNAVAVLTVINGPVRQQLEINCSYGLLGPGWRANATVGRTVRLIQLNIAGSIPGPVSKSTHGQPGRYTLCFGEFEERNPWEPLHVEHGFEREESTVTLFAAQGTVPITETRLKSGKALIHFIAHCQDIVGTNNMLPGHPGDSVLILCPDHAMVIHRDGYSKKAVKEALFELTRRIPVSRWPEERHGELIKEQKAKGGVVSLHEGPDNFQIVVAGGLGGFHSTWVPTYAHSRALTKKIRTRN
ncbi:MAG: hypothetical protein HY684_03785 [Chloroflexi bacterium]|nr:hypothetical protein [Chloroflexota bacterium]